MSEILTAEQAAEYLQLDPETVRRAARRGELPGARIGRRWRFRKQDLDVGRKDGELVLKAGGHTRIFSLPDTLVDREIAGATFKEGTLAVAFE